MPILYTFRRCPYAIRARMALAVAQIPYEAREVSLKAKPDLMLKASPKGTVPVLVLENDVVIDESLDIMKWALKQHDPDSWLPSSSSDVRETDLLISLNDGDFKVNLDAYKYHVHHPAPKEELRMRADSHLADLERRIKQEGFLLGNNCTLADVAIFPFIRQFRAIDAEWFDAEYRTLVSWLEHFLKSALFLKIMKKQDTWNPQNEIPL